MDTRKNFSCTKTLAELRGKKRYSSWVQHQGAVWMLLRRDG